MASKTMKMEMRHRNSPLANPESVSTREYLNKSDPRQSLLTRRRPVETHP